MANDFRYLYGETNPIQAPVTATAVISIGDMCILNDRANILSSLGAGSGNPPATADWTAYSFTAISSNSQAVEEALASDHFLGVAGQASASGETDDIRVDTDGIFEMSLDTSGTIFLLNQLEAYSTALHAVQAQTVVKGTTDPLGRAVERNATAKLKVKLRIATTYRPVFA